MSQTGTQGINTSLLREQPVTAKIHELASVPQSIEDTGLSRHFLTELLAKHLYEAGDLDVRSLSARMALGWRVTEQFLTFMRENAQLEIFRGRSDELRYRLTDRGRNLALEALNKGAYVGPAPITHDHYCRLVRRQSVRNVTTSVGELKEAYSDAVGADSMLEQLGPAIVSGRAMILYGPPGTGKTYLAQRITRVLAGDVYIPHAIIVADKLIRIFDPVVHHRREEQGAGSSLMMHEQTDPRLILCRRPAVIVGGELTLEMLELGFDATSKSYQAPPHMKANNGVFVIDDLGRQRLRTMDLLNRWIVPLEEKRDFLTVGSASRFEVPFDNVLVFSTNMNPLDLADDAFLRRLGYKLRINQLGVDDYRLLWNKQCEANGLDCDEKIVDSLLHDFYEKSATPLTPCHPRDLLGLVSDQCRFHGLERRVTRELLAQAWENYFVSDQKQFADASAGTINI